MPLRGQVHLLCNLMSDYSSNLSWHNAVNWLLRKKHAAKELLLMIKTLISLFALILFAGSALATPLAIEQAGPGIYVHHGVLEDLAEGYHGDICNAVSYTHLTLPTNR